MDRVVIVAILGACTPPALPIAPHARPIALEHTLVYAGEAMQYGVSMGGLAIANAQIAVGQPGVVDGRPAVMVRAHAQTSSVFDFLGTAKLDLQSTIDTTTGAPIHSVLEVDASSAAGDKDHHRVDHVWTRDESGHDVLSAAGALRAWQSHPDDRLEVRVGIAGRHELDIVIWDAGRTHVGRFPAVRYDGIVADELHLTVWLADDASRVPLQLELVTRWGTLRAELTDYTPPTS